MTRATRQPVLLDLYVNEGDWSGIYDRLQVWRSRSGAAGPYEELTADTWLPARIPEEAVGEASSDPGPLVNLSGRTLEFEVNGSVSVSIGFTGPDPVSWAGAAAQITTGARGLVRSFHTSLGSVGWLVIETEAPGLQACLRIVGGSAGPLLGLPVVEPGSIAFGRDPRIPLLSGFNRYSFTDPNGSPGYYYKTRYFNSTTQQRSELSTAFQAPAIARLSKAALIRGTVSLVDGSGNPIANRTVLVSLRLQGKPVEERVIVGGPSFKLTDKNGVAEFMLVRGASITVSVAGTDLARSVEVPTDPSLTSFDLLSPAFGKDDLFNVQRPDISFAVRRSL